VVAPSTGGPEPGSTATAQASIEVVEAAASARDVGWADVDQEVVEAPPEAGQEAAQPEEPQPQHDQPAEPMVEVESGVDAPPPIVPVVAPVVEAPAPPQGSTPSLIDLTLNDSPGPLRRRRATRLRCQLGGQTLPGWLSCGRRRSSHAGGGRPSSLGTRPTLAQSPSSRSMTRMRCTTGSTSRVSGSTRCDPCVWFQIPWHGVCQMPSR
jgi:hypothetical protein